LAIGRCPAAEKGLVARLVDSGIGGIEFGEPCRQRCCHACDVARIGLDVWIAARMHIAVGTIEASRFLEHPHVLRSFEIARFSRLHPGISRLLQHQRQPADFEFSAGRDNKVGTACTGDQTRPCFNVMRVLQGVGGRVNLDLFTAQFFGQCAPFGYAGENVQHGERRCRKGGKDQRRQEL
jgi:hypothetical protein